MSESPVPEEAPDTPLDHRYRASRCPVLVVVNGLMLRCCDDSGHTNGHRTAGSDYLDAEHAARAARWRQEHA
jgi:hypothetical protein